MYNIENSEKDLIEKYFDENTDFPEEVIIKEDILKNGVNYTDESLLNSKFQEKAYFLFTFDVDTPDKVKSKSKIIPQEFKIKNGIYNLKDTIIQSRYNYNSPYKIDFIDNKLKLLLDNKIIADVEFVPEHDYYKNNLSDGTRIDEIAPAIYWGETLDITVFRICEYWGLNEECKFCDINENYRSWGFLRKDVGSIIKPEKVAEAISIASKDKNVKRYLITGGSIKNHEKEFNFYIKYIKEIESIMDNKLPSRLNIEAMDNNYLEKFYEAGVDYYHPNLEIYDKKLFSFVSPGKNKFVGYDQWVNAILNANKIFGTGNVSPNFVAGAELLNYKDYGFNDINKALDSTIKGIEYFMENGVTPKFDSLAIEPLSWYGKNIKIDAPLYYYIKLYRKYHEFRKMYGLPYPNGLGEGGTGRSKVPASAFMDL